MHICEAVLYIEESSIHAVIRGSLYVAYKQNFLMLDLKYLTIQHELPSMTV